MHLLPFLMYMALLATISPLQAKELRTIEVSDASIEVRVFAAQGKRLLLGFPCDEGKSVAEEKTAASLAEDGIEVWMPDMLSGYMLPNVRSSRYEIPTEAIVGLIAEAMKTGKQVYLIASGQDTEIILRGAARWEAEHQTRKLAGAVLMFPRLFKEEPVPGVIPEYVDAVGKTQLPIVMLEGERTPNRWGVKSLSSELEQGGSQVISKLIPTVRGFFFKRQDPTRSEEVVTSQLAGLVKVSLYYLETMQ